MMGNSREWKYQQFLCLTTPSKDSMLLDVGVTNQEYSPFDNYLEKRYPHPDRITALSIDDLKIFSAKYPSIKAVTYSGGLFPFKDKQFDVVFSNAVIEHVGGFDKQIQFINEMNRVGHQFYFSTPAIEFPIEIHTNYPFIHWFPKPLFNIFVKILGKEWASGNYLNLLSKRNVEFLLKTSNVRQFKLLLQKFGPFPLQYIVWGEG
jgi:SAM-dependent methyltransferase